jgi:hypothetical protein
LRNQVIPVTLNPRRAEATSTGFSVAEEPFILNYKFKLGDGTEKLFVIRLNQENLSLIGAEGGTHPEWTRLDNKKCGNCPLDSAQHPHCPVAVALEEAIDFFKDRLSSDRVDVEVTMPTRTYLASQPMSTAASSLIGIYMVTSGCPILGKLKPMVRTHLPFADLSESLYRFISMYMLGQHFRAKRGQQADVEMKNFAALLEDMRTVNRSFCQRLYSVCEKDASLNALVHLDCFADNTAFAVQKRGLEGIESTFDDFLRD